VFIQEIFCIFRYNKKIKAMKEKETFLDSLFGNVLEQAEELIIEGEKLIERLKKEFYN
jgi:hypothetical protein